MDRLFCLAQTDADQQDNRVKCKMESLSYIASCHLYYTNIGKMSVLACRMRLMPSIGKSVAHSSRSITFNRLMGRSIFSSANRNDINIRPNTRSETLPSKTSVGIAKTRATLLEANSLRMMFRDAGKRSHNALGGIRFVSSTTTVKDTDIEELQYTPMRSNYRHRWIMWVVIGMNIVVTVMWKESYDHLEEKKDDSYLILMRELFVPRWKDLQEGRWWMLMTCAFSHTTITRLAWDVGMLYTIAPPLAAVIGPSMFLGLYICSGATTALSCLLWKRYSGDIKGEDLDNLGADGECTFILDMHLYHHII